MHGYQEPAKIGDGKKVLIELTNGVTRKSKDYTTTLLLYPFLGTGFFNRLAGGNATILMWECPLVIFGKSLCDRNLQIEVTITEAFQNFTEELIFLRQLNTSALWNTKI